MRSDVPVLQKPTATHRSQESARPKNIPPQPLRRADGRNSASPSCEPNFSLRLALP